MPELVSPPLLEVDGLTIDFKTKEGIFRAIRGVSFTLGDGESLALIGESGSGKSVTANAILGLLDCPPAIIRSGDIRFKGRSLLHLPRSERPQIYGRHIAVVFQDPRTYLNPVYPVGWQIAEVCLIHGMGRREARARSLELLDQVGIANPAKRSRDYPHQFSGGQRQRIMIAMAMALRPDILIADEPTTALDVTVQATVLELLRKMQADTGTAVIMITHDLGVAADMSERVIVMKNGEFVEQGPIRQVFREPQHPYTSKLLAARNASSAGTRAPGEETLLEVNSLVVKYGPVKALDGVDLKLRKNEIVCIVGKSGSGKSTLANVILGLTNPDSGSVSYRSREIGSMNPGETLRYRRAVQAVFQDPFSSLNPRMTVRDVIAEPWHYHPDAVPKSMWTSRAAELLESVGLSRADLEKYPGDFSGGQRQRIAIARALALQSEVVICDEAVSSLDMSVQAQVVTLLSRLRSEFGVALLFITHDLGLVRQFADRVVVMKDGKIVEEGPTDKIFNAPEDIYTRTLLAATPVADPDQQFAKRQAFNALGKKRSDHPGNGTGASDAQG